MRNAVMRQFERPHGPLGALAGWIMANRPSNKTRNDWTVDLLDPKPADHVLELGCGPGLALRKVCARVTGGRVLAIDHSALMVRMARARNRSAIGDGRLELRQGGIELLETIGEQFDLVYSVNVAMFWRDRRGTLETIKRVLKPGGRIASTYQPRHPGAKPADALAFAGRLRGELTEAGFRDIRVDTLDLRPIPAICVQARA
jgi:ubiquinone/menaquinone biosynthesis C-methylase UbiE